MSADILTFIIFLPAIMAFALMVSTKNVEAIRNMAFLTTLVIFVLVLTVSFGVSNFFI